jgi:hypothetical protein
VSVSPCALARAHRGLISCRLGAKWKRLKAQEGVSKQHGGDAAPMQSEAKSNCCAGLASLIDGGIHFAGHGHDPVKSHRTMISSPCLIVIFLENRFLLFRIPLQD